MALYSTSLRMWSLMSLKVSMDVFADVTCVFFRPFFMRSLDVCRRRRKWELFPSRSASFSRLMDIPDFHVLVSNAYTECCDGCSSWISY